MHLLQAEVGSSAAGSFPAPVPAAPVAEGKGRNDCATGEAKQLFPEARARVA